MTGPVVQAAPDAEYEDVGELRRPSQVTVSVRYAVRVERAGSAVHAVCLPIGPEPKKPPCPCATCTGMARAEAKWRGL